MAPPAKRQKTAMRTRGGRPDTSARGTRDIASFFSPSKGKVKAQPRALDAPSSDHTAGPHPAPSSPPEPPSDEQTEQDLLSQGLTGDAILALQLHAAEADVSLADACATLGVEVRVASTSSAVVPRTSGPSDDYHANEQPEIVDLSSPVESPAEFEDVLLERRGDEDEDEEWEEVRSINEEATSPALPHPSPSDARHPPSPVSAPALPPAETSARGPEVLDLALEAIPLEEDVFLFDPVRDVDTSAWPQFGPDDERKAAPFGLLSRAFVLLSSTRSRLKIVTVLTNVLRVLLTHDPTAVLPAVYLVSNHIAPSYDGVELGVGGRTLNRVVSSVTSASPALMKQLWARTGDPGDVAFEARKARGNRRLFFGPAPSALLISGVFDTLLSIAASTGQGSANRKADLVTRLLRATRGEEIRFVARILLQHLRIQAVKTTISVALARAFALANQDAAEHADPYIVTPEERRELRLVPAEKKASKRPREGLSLAAQVWGSEAAAQEQLARIKSKLLRGEQVVRRVFAQHPNFSDLVPALLTGGLGHLATAVPLQVGTPILPMLGSITRSLDAMFARMQLSRDDKDEDGDQDEMVTPAPVRAFVSEFKYDGQRVQVHALFLPLHPEISLAQRKRASVPEGVGGARGVWVPVPGQGEVWVRLFSRHLEDMTGKYPDITQLMPYLMGWRAEGPLPPPERRIKSLILDGEIVAVSPTRGSGPFTSPADLEILPFQVLSNRSRKNVALEEVKITVGVFAFDLMLLDGEPLLQAPLRQRRELLQTRLPPLEVSTLHMARFAHVQSHVCESGTRPAQAEVRTFFDLARKSRCEGIMVKTLDSLWQKGEGLSERWEAIESDRDHDRDGDGDGDGDGAADAEALAVVNVAEDVLDEADAEEVLGPGGRRGKALLSTYEPDRRAESWLKVKKDYVEGVGDSLDLVPIGGWHGMGRKAAWWSPILLAIVDPDTHTYTAVCKCMSGFTDEEYIRIFRTFTPANCAAWDPRMHGTQPPPLAGVGFGDEDGGGGGDGAADGGTDGNTESVHEEAEATYELGPAVPEILFRPREVWEIRAAELSLSPVYTAAQEATGTARGLSLRFPRFVRVRHDRNPTQASTAHDLARLWRAQQS